MKTDLSGHREEMASFRLIVVIGSAIPPEQNPLPPVRPYRLTSIHNSFDFDLYGEFESQGSGEVPDEKKVLIRSRFTLPVGWDCIEVYPTADLAHWKPELAPLWAENDLLAAVAMNHVRDQAIREIDPYADARKRFGNLLTEFRSLLDSDPPEEVIQKFLEENPHMLAPTHTICHPKLQLGGNVTDFIIRHATGDYLLVELERPGLRLFREDGQQRVELTHAVDQVANWKRYIADNLDTVRRELDLEGISSNPSSLIVIGRSSSLSEENKRKLQVLNDQSPRVSIMTYDDLLETAKSAVENLLGVIWETSPSTQVFYLPPGKGTPGSPGSPTAPAVD